MWPTHVKWCNVPFLQPLAEAASDRRSQNVAECMQSPGMGGYGERNSEDNGEPGQLR